MSTLLKRALVASACVISLAACTESGTPTPTTGGGQTPTSDSQAPTTTADNAAPSVENPLKADAQLAKPCTALSSSQQQELGLEKPQEADKADFERLGPYCSWYKNGLDITYLVGFLTPNKNGMADVYRGKDQGHWEYFEPTTIDGYPAVFGDASDRRGRGICNIMVGIQDTLVFNTRVEFAGDKACDMAKEAAGKVIETLKSGG